MICRSINLQMRAPRTQVEKVLEVESQRGGLEEIIPLISGERQSAAGERRRRVQPVPRASP
jgi:hypothetical protein